MHYRFAVRRDHSDLSSGRVLRSAPALPAFPVRLAEEMFQVACAGMRTTGPMAVLDPCCGAAYLLTVLGFLFPDKIRALAGLDTDARALELAAKNLRLLSPEGLRERLRELEHLRDEHGRESHQAAVDSARTLLKTRDGGNTPETLVRPADATSPESVLAAVGARTFELAVCDLPHGQLVSWQGRAATVAPDAVLPELLAATSPVLSADATWIVAALKHQRPTVPAGYRITGRMRVGHRAIQFVRRS